MFSSIWELFYRGFLCLIIVLAKQKECESVENFHSLGDFLTICVRNPLGKLENC